MNLPSGTDRIRFREYSIDDLDVVVSMFSDVRARRFYPEMEEPHNNRRWIEWSLENYREFGFGLWVIEDSRTGEFLGDCGITYQPVESEKLLEIGYHLVEQHRGHGYATEAGSLCLAYGFDFLGADVICSLVHPENQASIQVASRLHDHRRVYLKGDGSQRLLFWSESPSVDSHSSPLPGLKKKR